MLLSPGCFDKICSMTYLGQRVTSRGFELRSNFDLDSNFDLKFDLNMHMF